MNSDALPDRFDWTDCEDCVQNAEELRVVGPDHRNFREGECAECGHVTTEADLSVCICMAETLPDGTCSECRREAKRV